jgi:hypothetical protein
MGSEIEMLIPASRPIAIAASPSVPGGTENWTGLADAGAAANATAHDATLMKPRFTW